MSATYAGDDAVPFNRYEGKPFLRFVDSFVLKAIGALDPEMDAKLVAATPKLQAAFNSSGSWEDIVMEQLDFPHGVRAEIQALWSQNQLVAQEHGGVLEPMQFVELFVADNIMDS
jgi:hypothetical protein